MGPDSVHTGILEEQDVVIPGGGIAGLKAGYVLQRAGRSVVVLERGKRNGGRVHTNESGYEMGAEQLFGPGAGRDIRQLGLQVDSVSPMENSQTYLSACGKLLPAEELFGGGNGQRDIAREIIEESKGEMERNPSLRDFLDRSKVFRSLTSCQRRIMSNLLSGEFGHDADKLGIVTLQETSVLTPGAEDWTYRINGGFSQLSNKLSQGLDVRLNTAMTGLTVDTGGVTVHTNGPTHYRAKESVMALSFQALQQLSVQPGSMPDTHREALKHLGGASVVKLFADIVSEHPPWPKDVGLINTDSIPQVLWVHSDRRIGNHHPVTAYIAGTYAERLGMVLNYDRTVAEEMGKLYIGSILHGARDKIRSIDFSVWYGETAAHSYVKPGPDAVHARTSLGIPWTDAHGRERVTPVGEYCSPHPATVYGAFVSGREGAQAVEQRLI